MAGPDGQSETQQLELTVQDDEEEQEEIGEEQAMELVVWWRLVLGGVEGVWQTAIYHRSLYGLLGNWYML